MTTYDADGNEVESFSDGGILGTMVLNSSGRYLIGFKTTQPFSEVSYIIGTVLCGSLFWEVRVYNAVIEHFCPTFNEACNTSQPLVRNNFPVFTDAHNTVINSGALVNNVINNLNNLVDDNGANYAAISTVASGAVTASVAVQDGTGTALLAAASSDVLTGGNDRQIVGIIAKVPFDEVQVSISQIGSVNLGTVEIYRPYIQTSCLHSIPCNVTYYITHPNNSAVIDAAHTCFTGGICAACKVDNAWNAVSASTTDFARIYNTGSGLATGSLAVATTSATYPAGTFAGFTIKKNPFIISTGLFTGITFLDGVEQESKSDGALADLTVLFQLFGTPPDFYNPGFITTKPFDEIKISVGSLVNALDQYVDVYGAFVDTHTSLADPMLPCSLPVKLMGFTVSKEGLAAQLEWTTTEEINSDYFDLQHSLDAKTWKTIASLKAQGESTQINHYDYTHTVPFAGANYYRLKMVDRDAAFAFSTIRSVNFEAGA